VIPLFHEQIRSGGPVTITTPEMTRFLLPLTRAVATVAAALAGASPGDTYVPKVPAARIEDVAKALIGDRPIEIRYTGIRPGEKVHEIMVSEEEAWRAYDRGDYYAILPLLPELAKPREGEKVLGKEYSSADSLLSLPETAALLADHNLMTGQPIRDEWEILR
jgi:UDP-glucose 4-epimerase